jgi:hypothetical protein
MQRDAPEVEVRRGRHARDSRIPISAGIARAGAGETNGNRAAGDATQRIAGGGDPARPAYAPKVMNRSMKAVEAPYLAITS